MTRPHLAVGLAAACALIVGVPLLARAAPTRSLEATLDVRCAGSEVAATLTPAPGQKVTKVVFALVPAGVGSTDMTRPFEAHFDQARQVGARETVSAEVFAAGQPDQVVSKTIKRCPRVVRKRLPLKSSIVEGVSIGGAAIGMTKGEVEEQWGTPRSSDCHGSSGSEPPGSWTYENGGLSCDWAIFQTAGGVGSGLIGVFFGGEELTVLGLSLWSGDLERPKYRGWKTSRGIGLGSSIAALRGAYGGALRKVPPRPQVLPELDRTYYVATVRKGKKWITAFSLPTATTHGREKSPPAYVVDRVSQIEILSAPSFRQLHKGYARPTWRP